MQCRLTPAQFGFGFCNLHYHRHAAVRVPCVLFGYVFIALPVVYATCCVDVLLADGGIWYNRIQAFHTASHVDLKHLLG